MDKTCIDDVICEIMVHDGPDGHIDGHEFITEFIEAILVGQGSDWAQNYAHRHAGKLLFLKSSP